jgi:hypothetical protein
MIGEQPAIPMDYTISFGGWQSRLDCHEFPPGNRCVLDIITTGPDDTQGHVTVFGIKVAANKYVRVGPSLELPRSVHARTTLVQTRKGQTDHSPNFSARPGHGL